MGNLFSSSHALTRERQQMQATIDRALARERQQMQATIDRALARERQQMQATIDRERQQMQATIDRERQQMQATIDRDVSSAIAQRYVSDCVSAGLVRNPMSPLGASVMSCRHDITASDVACSTY